MAENELANELKEIHESKNTNKIEVQFKKVAEEIFNKHILVVKNKKKEIIYRITEIEFYYNDECDKNKHPDPYSHRDYRQRLNEQWYFHRKGRGGLDITFGKGEKYKIYGGILIRAIEKFDDPNEYIEGPFKVVEKIFEVINSKEDKNILKKRIKGKCIFNTNNILHLAKNDLYSQNEIAVYNAPRVGLYPDKDKPDWEKFIMKNYRYLKYKEKGEKRNKELHALKMFIENNDPIYFGTNTLNNYKDNYKIGKNSRENNEKEKDAKKIINEINTNFGVPNKCKLYGLLNEGDQIKP